MWIPANLILSIIQNIRLHALLEFGDEPAIRWMRENFSPSAIEAVLRGDARLSQKTAAFWALVLGIPLSEVPALAIRPEER